MPEAPVVNDPAAADIDAVMGEAEARSDKVCAQRGFLVVCQKSFIADHHRAGSMPRTVVRKIGGSCGDLHLVRKPQRCP